MEAVVLPNGPLWGIPPEGGSPYGPQVPVADIAWIPAGRRFTSSDMVFHRGRGEDEIDDVLGRIDLVVTGPHATAAFPAELQPFVDPALTARLQFDFCDISTSPVARRWAALDPKVLYVENPHPRAVRDANRARPADLLATLREAFDRLERDPGGRPSLTGVDAVRPVTFGYLPVLRRPESDSEWSALGRALESAGTLGVDAYERVRDDLIERVVEAKLRRLATLDPAEVSVADWRSAHTLDVLSIHDTMNHTALPDGAIRRERAPEDRLPNVVALSNRGDEDGEVRERDDAGVRDELDVPTMAPARLRSIGAAYRAAFGAHDPDDVAYNRPYLGGYETQTIGPRLRHLEPLAVVRPSGMPVRRLRLGAWQNEFLREFLLGPEATDALMRPGSDWQGVPADRADRIATALKEAHDLVRRWGTQLDDGRRSSPTVRSAGADGALEPPTRDGRP